MLCTPRKENVSKLEITLARFTTQNQLPSFHLRTHIAWMKSQSSTKQRNGVLSCLDPNNKSRVSERILMECCQIMNCLVPVMYLEKDSQFKSVTYKPIKTAVKINDFIQL